MKIFILISFLSTHFLFPSFVTACDSKPVKAKVCESSLCVCKNKKRRLPIIKQTEVDLTKVGDELLDFLTNPATKDSDTIHVVFTVPTDRTVGLGSRREKVEMLAVLSQNLEEFLRRYEDQGLVFIRGMKIGLAYVEAPSSVLIKILSQNAEIIASAKSFDPAGLMYISGKNEGK